MVTDIKVLILRTLRPQDVKVYVSTECSKNLTNAAISHIFYLNQKMLNLENGLIWKIQPDYAVYMPCGVIVGITVECEWAHNKVNVYWLCSPGAPTYSNLTHLGAFEVLTLG